MLAVRSRTTSLEPPGKTQCPKDGLLQGGKSTERQSKTIRTGRYPTLGFRNQSDGWRHWTDRIIMIIIRPDQCIGIRRNCMFHHIPIYQNLVVEDYGIEIFRKSPISENQSTSQLHGSKFQASAGDAPAPRTFWARMILRAN